MDMICDVCDCSIHRLFLRGYRRPLTYDDLYDLKKGDKSSNVVARFNYHWKKQLKKAG